MLSDLVYWFGIAFGLLLAKKAFSLIRHCLVFLMPPRADFGKFADGGFALITGGAGGIGKATAVEFAKLGIDLYLMDYNGTLLEKTTAEITKKYPKITVKSKTIDLRKLTDEKEYEKLAEELSKLKIGILFNCAGIAEMKTLRFNSSTHGELVEINEINATVPVLLYRAVLPQMIERRNGLMLAMSSASSMVPAGVLPVYGSTKSYLLQLSQSLQNQFPYEYSGVYFHAFKPWFIETPMTKELKLSRWIKPDVEDWVKSALKTVMANNNGHSTGFLVHDVLMWFYVNIEPTLEKLRLRKPPSTKYKDDPRFKHTVQHEINSNFFQKMIAKNPNAFDL